MAHTIGTRGTQHRSSLVASFVCDVFFQERLAKTMKKRGWPLHSSVGPRCWPVVNTPKLEVGRSRRWTATTVEPANQSPLIDNRTSPLKRSMRLPSGWWKSLNNQREFISDLGKSLGVTQVSIFITRFQSIFVIFAGQCSYLIGTLSLYRAFDLVQERCCSHIIPTSRRSFKRCIQSIAGIRPSFKQQIVQNTAIGEM